MSQCRRAVENDNKNNIEILNSVVSLPKGIGHFKSTECQPKLLSEWNFRSRENDQHLAAGGSLYNFVCAPGSRLPTTVVTMISKFIHLSGLSEDIQRDHPHSVDMFNEKELDAHIFIFNKAQYVFPDPLKPEYFTPEFLSSVEYQRNCQPGNPTIWTNVTEVDTFRMTRTLIPFIFNVTVQLQVSIVDKSHWSSLSEYVNDKLPVHHALLIERTKRNWNRTDSTRLVKSILLFHTPPDGGILVTSITAIANTALPTVVGKIINSFGSSGAAEVAETAENTRKYMLSECKEPFGIPNKQEGNNMKFDPQRITEVFKAAGSPVPQFDESSIAGDLMCRLDVISGCLLILGEDFMGVDLGVLRSSTRQPSVNTQSFLTKLLMDMGLIPSTKGEIPTYESAMCIIAGTIKTDNCHMRLLSNLLDIIETTVFISGTGTTLEAEYKRSCNMTDVILRNHAIAFSRTPSNAIPSLSASEKAKIRSSVSNLSVQSMKKQVSQLKTQLQQLEEERQVVSHNTLESVMPPSTMNSKLVEWSSVLSDLTYVSNTFIQASNSVALPTVKDSISSSKRDRIGELASTLAPFNKTVSNLETSTSDIQTALNNFNSHAESIISELNSLQRKETKSDIGWATECVRLL